MQLAAFKQLLRESCSTDWVVYSKRPFANAERVLRYPGRYTHRVVIANSRIISMNANSVMLRFKARKHGGSVKTMTPDVMLFMQRFLLHILPKGFVRIRSYGFLGNPSKKESIALCRELLGEDREEQPPGRSARLMATVDAISHWLRFLSLPLLR